MKMLKKFFTPFANGSKKSLKLFWCLTVLVIFGGWTFFRPATFPSPWQVFEAFQTLLFEDGLIPNTFSSLTVLLVAMLFATIISLTLAYAASTVAFRPTASIIAATRALAPSALVPFAMLIGIVDGYYIKVAIMTFAVTVFYLTALKADVLSTPIETLSYGHTLRLKGWRALLELVVLGRLHVAYDLLSQNFLMGWAMLLTVEAIIQGGGGIGRLMYHDQRHSNLASLLGLLIWSGLFGLLMDLLFKQGKRLFVYIPKEVD